MKRNPYQENPVSADFREKLEELLIPALDAAVVLEGEVRNMVSEILDTWEPTDPDV